MIREESGDMFGLGARDAVLLAAGHGDDTRGFLAQDEDYDLLELAREGVDLALADAELTDGSIEVRALNASPAAFIAAGTLAERLRILSRALGQEVTINVV